MVCREHARAAPPRRRTIPTPGHFLASQQRDDHTEQWGNDPAAEASPVEPSLTIRTEIAGDAGAMRHALTHPAWSSRFPHTADHCRSGREEASPTRATPSDVGGDHTSRPWGVGVSEMDAKKHRCARMTYHWRWRKACYPRRAWSDSLATRRAFGHTASCSAVRTWAMLAHRAGTKMRHVMNRAPTSLRLAQRAVCRSVVERRCQTAQRRGRL